MKKSNNSENQMAEKYVVNFFATPVINYSLLISEQASKESSNPVYTK